MAGKNAGGLVRAKCGSPGLDRLPREPDSDEGESQQAGAEQGHPACSQGKEAVGNEISISHDTPSDL
jgi:hypothetical protein